MEHSLLAVIQCKINNPAAFTACTAQCMIGKRQMKWSKFITAVACEWLLNRMLWILFSISELHIECFITAVAATNSDSRLLKAFKGRIMEKLLFLQPGSFSWKAEYENILLASSDADDAHMLKQLYFIIDSTEKINRRSILTKWSKFLSGWENKHDSNITVCYAVTRPLHCWFTVDPL